ncbi:MAG: DUF2358 domain-containing protein [Cyanobacteria bacterium]|nr:DUF2358 domain-containing protein [Cyanobacteriota bacterium]
MTLTPEAVGDRLRQDYAQFPAHQSYDLYAPDVYFQDPLNRFRGVEKYRDMIGFIARWFINPALDLHALTYPGPDQIETQWTLRWVAPLPWRPAMAISGWTEYRLNDNGLIVAHIDYWHCSRWSVVQQLWSRSHP